MAKIDALAAIRRELATKRGARKTAWQELERRKHAVAKAGSRGMSPSSPTFKALDAAGRKYDGICDEIASQEHVLAHMAEMNGPPPKEAAVSFGATAARLFGSSHGVDVEAFMREFRAWAGQDDVAGVLATPHLPFRLSPSFPFIAKDQFQAAAVSLSTFPGRTFRTPGAEPAPQPNLALLGLIAFEPTDFDQVEFMLETVYDAAAAETAEGDDAPDAELVYTPQKTPVRNFALHLPATNRVLSDTAALEALLSGQLVSAVMQRLQSQIIAGNGEGENLLGIVNSDIGIQNIGGDSCGDAIQWAIARIRKATLSLYEPNILLLHPDDALTMGIDQDEAKAYIFNPAARNLWGLQPVVHSSVPEGTPLVGDTRSVTGYVCEDCTVSMSRSHDDHFAKGIVDFLAAGRWAFAVRSPAAWCLVADFQS